MSTQAAQPLSITDQIRRSVQTAVRVYNAGDEPFTPVYSSIAYPCDGENAGKGIQPGEWITIPDRADYQRNERGRILWDEPMEVPKGATAAEIAGQILEHYQENGITVLLNDGQDEERIRYARKLYIARKVELCTEIRTAWLRKLELVAKSPGSIPPSQPQNVRDALQFLRKYEGGFIDRKRFVTFDGVDFDSKDEAVAYLREMHTERLAAEGGLEGWMDRAARQGGQAPYVDVEDVKRSQPHATGAVTTEPAARVVPEKRSEPEAAPLPENDAAFLLGKAQELGVRLTAKELTALIRQDRDEIEAITEKLAVAAAKAKAGKKA